MRKKMLTVKNFKTCLLFIMILFFSFPLNAQLVATSFEIDGDKTALPGGVDWDSGVQPAYTTSGGNLSTGVYYNHADGDPCNSDLDDTGDAGEKVGDGAEWSSIIKKPTTKTDIEFIMLAAEKVDVVIAGSHQIHDILYGGFQRCGYDPGTAGNGGTWTTMLFFDDGDDSYPSDGDNGDWLFTFEFNPSTTGGDTGVLFWKRINGAWVEQTVDPNAWWAAMETTDGDFGEVALNLTLLGILPEDGCSNVAATGQGGTVAGGDLNSQVKDLVSVMPLETSNCGNLEVQKLTNLTNLTSNDVFHYNVYQLDNEYVHTEDLTRVGSGITDEVPTYDGNAMEIDSEISADSLHIWDYLICQPDYTIEEDILAADWTIDSCECTYYDIFDGLNPVNVLIYSGGLPTGNTFTIPPAEYYDAAGDLQLVPNTRCVITNYIGADFDDLPASYDPVGGDPASAVRSGVFIGADVTTETAGWDDVAANMDTDNGIVGTWPKWSGSTAVPVPCTGLLEDGLSGTVSMDDDTYCFTVKATNGSTTDDAQLVAWIDWNLNGVFDDPAERSVVLTDGSTGNVPAGATDVDVVVYWNGVTKMTDPTYARLRITTDASFKSATSPSPIGATGDGEVEGYLIPENSLPVELTSFTTVATMTGIQVEWTTQSETENLGFVLERKTKDGAWQELASYKTNEELLGQGTVNAATDYEYLDDLVQANTTYEYRLADVDFYGVVTYQATRTVKADNKILTSKIQEFTVLPAYPNPFNPVTTINYGLDVDNHVSVEIYNISGNLVTTLVNEDQTQGWHSVIWNGTNRHGKSVPAGMYLSKITSGAQVKTSKLMLLK